MHFLEFLALPLPRLILILFFWLRYQFHLRSVLPFFLPTKAWILNTTQFAHTLSNFFKTFLLTKCYDFFILIQIEAYQISPSFWIELFWVLIVYKVVFIFQKLDDRMYFSYRFVGLVFSLSVEKYVFKLYMLIITIDEHS